MWRVWRCCRECSAVCSILHCGHAGSEVVMVWGYMCLDGCTDLHVLTRGTMTAAWETWDPQTHSPCRWRLPSCVWKCLTFCVWSVSAVLGWRSIDANEWSTCSTELNPSQHLRDIMYSSISHQLSGWCGWQGGWQQFCWLQKICQCCPC